MTNREFTRTPHLLPDDLKEAMAKTPEMTNPKPDHIFGRSSTHNDTLDQIVVPSNIRELLEIMPQMHCPFFVIEGKSHSGSPAEAQNQACRAGGALVWATRSLLYDILNQPHQVRPDYDSFVFSATLSPELLDMWCQWMDMFPGKVYMNHLASRALKDKDSFGKISKSLHNFLDWGLRKRFEKKVKVWYGLIAAHES